MGAITLIQDSGLRNTLTAEGVDVISFMPLAANAGHFLASAAPTAGSNKTTTLTSFAAANCPIRPVAAVAVATEGTGNTWTGVSWTLVGYDQFGDWTVETIAGSNSGGTWTATGAVCWRTLVSAAVTITGTADATDRYTLGYGKTYGIGRRIRAAADVLFKAWNGATESGTVSTDYHSYAIAGTPDAAKLLTLTVRTLRPYVPGGVI